MYSPDMNNSAIPQLRNCVAFLEATSFESHILWRDWANQAPYHAPDSPGKLRVDWESPSMGYGIHLGTVENLPVMVSVRIIKIDGQPVCVWEMTSRMVDYDMMEKFIVDLKPEFKDDLATRRNNASNAHIIMYLCKELAGKK